MAWGVCFFTSITTQRLYKNICRLVGAKFGTTTLENHLAIATKAQSINIL